MNRLTVRLLGGLLGLESLVVLTLTILIVPFRSATNRFGGGLPGTAASFGMALTLLAVGGLLAVAATGLWRGWEQVPGNRRFSDVLSVAAGLNLLGAVYVAAVLATSAEGEVTRQVGAAVGIAVAALAAGGCARAASAASRRRVTSW